MGLFTKRPIVENQTPLYTVSTSQTVLIIGLGNIGQEYDGTRHNIGFAAIDGFAKSSEFGGWQNKKDLKGHVSIKTLGSTRVILLKPTTLMNLSGEAAQATASFYKVPLEQIIVVHDELDIEFGQIRTRIGGSAAGHNGIKSISKHLGDDCGRIRIGIGPKSPEQFDSADFVLAKFNSDQKANMRALLTESSTILNEFVYGSQKLPAETRSFIV